MGQKVLVVYYTQSGQLGAIIDRFTAPLIAGGADIEKVEIKPKQAYPFPWTSDAFFGEMPPCVLLQPMELEPFSFQQKKYDLVILAYQPWFLSPSRPINSLLQHPSFKEIIAGTPVVTISGCRNMWLNAQEKVKKLLKAAGANLVGNIALVDRNNNHVSLVTIIHWMFSGRKDKKWGIFPKPGVSDEDIANSAIFGETVQQHLVSGQWGGLQEKLVAQKAVDVIYPLMFFENKGAKIFPIWAKAIDKKKNKKIWGSVFKYYLLVMIVLVGPILLLIDTLLFRVFKLNKIKKQKQYYAGVALN